MIGIEIRTGVHTGEIELRGDDIGGVAVHIAARVNNAAQNGEIWATSTVRDLVAGSAIEFAHRGQRSLNGVDRDWDLYQITCGPGFRQ